MPPPIAAATVAANEAPNAGVAEAPTTAADGRNVTMAAACATTPTVRTSGGLSDGDGDHAAEHAMTCARSCVKRIASGEKKKVSRELESGSLEFK